MSNVGHVFYTFTLSLYLVVTLLFFLDLKDKTRGLFPYVRMGLKAAFAGLTLLMLVRFLSYRYLPAYTFYETLLLLTFTGSLILILLEVFYPHSRRALYFAVPLFTFFLFLAGFFPGEGVALLSDLVGFWLFLHILLVMGAYGALAVAFIASLLYLAVDYYLKKKRTGEVLTALPPLSVLDNLNYLLVTAGFIMLTFSIILGAICGERVWGSFWRWDPKETWTLVTWLVYALYIHFRLISGWRGRNIVLINILGFGAIMFNYLIVRFFFAGGLHTFY